MMSSPEKLCGTEGSLLDWSPASLYGLYTQGAPSVHYVEMADALSAPLLTDPAQRMDWFHQCFGCMNAAMRARLIRNLQCISSSSFFSGIGGFETILFVLVAGVNKETGLDLDHVPCISACEMSRRRQLVLMELDERARPACLFEAIQERLPCDVYEECVRLTPTADSSDMACKWSYAKIDKLVETAYRTRRDECKPSPCVRHSSGDQSKCCDSSAASMRTFEVPDEDDTAMELTIVASSPVCTDATRQGKRRGDGGPAMLGLSVWRQEIRTSDATTLFSECVPDWRPEIQSSSLDERYTTYWAPINAGKCGDCYSRGRAITLSLRSDQVVLS